MIELVKYGVVYQFRLKTAFLFCPNGLDIKRPNVLKGRILEYFPPTQVKGLGKRALERCGILCTPFSKEATSILVWDIIELVPTFVI